MKLIKVIFMTMFLWLVGSLISKFILDFAFKSVVDEQTKDIVIYILVFYILITPIYVIRSVFFRKKNSHVVSGKLDVDNDNKVLTAEDSDYQLISKELQEEDTERDFKKIVSNLQKEEKFVLMVGLLALYGDGEISQKEI